MFQALLKKAAFFRFPCLAALVAACLALSCPGPDTGGGASTASYTVTVNLWANESDGNLLASPAGTQTISKAAGESAAFTVNNAGGYTGIEWYVDGQKRAEGQTTFTLNARDYALALHQVTVLLYKDNRPWSSSLLVKVAD